MFAKSASAAYSVNTSKCAGASKSASVAKSVSTSNSAGASKRAFTQRARLAHRVWVPERAGT